MIDLIVKEKIGIEGVTVYRFYLLNIKKYEIHSASY